MQSNAQMDHHGHDCTGCRTAQIKYGHPFCFSCFSLFNGYDKKKGRHSSQKRKFKRRKQHDSNVTESTVAVSLGQPSHHEEHLHAGEPINAACSHYARSHYARLPLHPLPLHPPVQHCPITPANNLLKLYSLIIRIQIWNSLKQFFWFMNYELRVRFGAPYVYESCLCTYWATLAGPAPGEGVLFMVQGLSFRTIWSGLWVNFLRNK